MVPGYQRVVPGYHEETFRLHPLTPIALGGRILGVLIVITALGFAEQQ